jgi:DNA repair ATPase RecN
VSTLSSYIEVQLQQAEEDALVAHLVERGGQILTQLRELAAEIKQTADRRPLTDSELSTLELLGERIAEMTAITRKVTVP